jgi:hypothetical protein
MVYVSWTFKAWHSSNSDCKVTMVSDKDETLAAHSTLTLTWMEMLISKPCEY